MGIIQDRFGFRIQTLLEDVIKYVKNYNQKH